MSFGGMTMMVMSMIVTASAHQKNLLEEEFGKEAFFQTKKYK
jgi:hypothetical protein